MYRSRFANFALLHKVKHACRPPFATCERVAQRPTAREVYRASWAEAGDLLRDDKLIAAERAVVREHSIPHGHVEAVLTAIRNSGLETTICSR